MAKHWYVVHTYAGQEAKVKEALEHRIESYGLEEVITKIEIPSEEVTEVKEGGKRVTKDVRLFPAYMLVRMELDDDSWAIVRNTPGVTGFVGAGGKPTPLSREQFNKIMNRTQPTPGSKMATRTATDLKSGQAIRVTSGPLATFEGRISEVMPEAGKVKVTLIIFGRETPVELTLDQIATIG